MRRLLALCVLCGLVACGGAPTATLAPYTGTRTHTYPSPGQFTVLSESGTAITLTVQGARKAVADSYVAAWQADGWKVASRRDAGPGTEIVFERAGQRLTVMFVDANGGGTYVTLPPQ